MAAFKEADFIYKDGKMVKWAEATTHVLTHSLHYGNAVFEGVRAYKIGDGFGIWRLDAHTQRLFESAKCCGIEIPFTREEINAAQQEILRVNTFADDVYIRPIVFLGYGKMGVSLVGCPVSVCVAAWEWGAYMGEEGLKNGIKVGISSWMKPAPFSMMARVKASANYFNSQMANYEAGLNGYDEALLLDPQGFIAEGPGECFLRLKTASSTRQTTTQVLAASRNQASLKWQNFLVTKLFAQGLLVTLPTQQTSASLQAQQPKLRRLAR